MGDIRVRVYSRRDPIMGVDGVESLDDARKHVGRYISERLRQAKDTRARLAILDWRYSITKAGKRLEEGVVARIPTEDGGPKAAQA